MRRILVTALIALLLLPMDAMGGQTHAGHDGDVTAAEVSHGDQGHSACGSTGDLTGSPDADSCLACAACVPLVAAPFNVGEAATGQRVAAPIFPLRTHDPVCELRPPRALLI